MADFDSQLDTVTAAINELENSLRTSFVYPKSKLSYPFDEKIKVPISSKQDYVIETANKTPDQSLIVGTAKSSRNDGDPIAPLQSDLSSSNAKSTQNNGNNGCSSQSLKIKPATYDGANSWIDYKAHFDLVAKVNNWSIDQRGLYLAVSLRGHAQSILGDLPVESRSDYESLITVLEERFAPPGQTELYRLQLRERRIKPGESLPELGQHIKRLSNLAYPTAPRDVRDILAKEQFLDALSDANVRVNIKQCKPTSLDEAIQLALELEAYSKTEKSSRITQGHLRCANVQVEGESEVSSSENRKAIEKLVQSVSDMSHILNNVIKEVNELKNKSRKPKVVKGGTNKKCSNCGRKNHVLKDCRLLKEPVNNDHTLHHAHNQDNYDSPGGATRYFYNHNLQHKRDRNTSDVPKIVRKRNRKVKSKFTKRVSDPGMYVNIRVEGETAQFLIDTGATVSIVSSKYFDTLKQKPTLSKYDRKITSANGSHLLVTGKGSFAFEMGDSVFPVDAIVADIHNADGVLGLDFLRNENCTIDIASGKLFVWNENPLRKKSFHIFAGTMPNTKTTPRKLLGDGQCQLTEKFACPLCPMTFDSKDKRNKHMVECTDKLLFCDLCPYNSTKRANLNKHIKNVHCSVGKEKVFSLQVSEASNSKTDECREVTNTLDVNDGKKSVSTLSESSSSEDTDSDDAKDKGENSKPENNSRDLFKDFEDISSSDVEEVLKDSEPKSSGTNKSAIDESQSRSEESVSNPQEEVGRLVRKVTQPAPVFTPKSKVVVNNTGAGRLQDLRRKLQKSTVPQPVPRGPNRNATVSSAQSSEPKMITKYVKIITDYEEYGKKIRIIEKKVPNDKMKK